MATTNTSNVIQVVEEKKERRNTRTRAAIGRRATKRRNAQAVFSRTLGELQALQGQSDARREDPVESHDASEVSVPKDPKPWPKDDTLKPIDDRVVVPTTFVAQDDYNTFGRRVATWLLSWLDGYSGSWLTRHTWKAAYKTTYIGACTRKQVWNDREECWELKEYWTTSEVTAETPLTREEVVTDGRVVLSRSFDLLRNQAQVLDWEVECVQRCFWFWLFPKRSVYKMSVSGSVAADVLSREGCVLTGEDDHTRLDTRYVQVAASTNIPYNRNFQLRDATVQFMQDFCSYKMYEAGFRSDLLDFRRRPVSL